MHTHLSDAAVDSTGSRRPLILVVTVATVWPQALVQACVLQLIRNTFGYASRNHWETMAKDLRSI